VKNTLKSFRILALAGPTASGKTALALLLAESLETEILSADSMQVYRGMDIGSAKPDLEEQRRARHHCIDVADPRNPFSVADYRRLATAVLERFQLQGRPIVVCGGTGLYLKALFEGLAEAPPPDFGFRAEMEGVAQREGVESLHTRLARADPGSAAKVHPHDRKRIIRALEIHHATGMTRTDFENQQPPPIWKQYVIWRGIRRPWADLDRRIDTRVDAMFRRGLVAEVQALVAQGCTLGHTAMQGLGYKEVLNHIEGNMGLDETIELVKQRTRRFARRQMTWFRSNPAIRWMDLGDRPPGGEHCDEILRDLVETELGSKSEPA
jgi:tRNA dimethylallyltransferase